MKSKLKIALLLSIAASINISNASNEMTTSDYDIQFNESEISALHSQHDKSQYTTNQPAKNKDQVFKECIIKSDNLITTIDNLKTMKPEDRIIALYKSEYWKLLSETDKDKTLIIMAKIEGISDTQYTIVKGRMAEIFKQECLSLK